MGIEEKLKKYKTDFPFILAPIAGYSDLAFRLLVNEFKNVLTFTEMVSSKALTYKDKKTKLLLNNTPNSETKKLLTNKKKLNTICQVFGSCSKTISESLKILDTEFDFVGYDINMACPVPKIFNNSEGSALLKDVKNIEQIIESSLKATSKPLSIKLRIGVNEKNINIKEVLSSALKCKLNMISIHPRTKEAYYRGEPKYDLVKNAIANTKGKKRSLPIFTLTGNIFDAKKAIMMKNDYDAIMIARGALGRPFIFKEIDEILKLNKNLNDKKKSKSLTEELKIEKMEKQIEAKYSDLKLIKETFIKHLLLLSKTKGERIAVKEIRKFVGYYFVNVPNIKKFKNKINQIDNIKEIVSEVSKI